MIVVKWNVVLFRHIIFINYIQPPMDILMGLKIRVFIKTNYIE